jgi:uncharacterized protein (DUF697 family)
MTGAAKQTVRRTSLVAGAIAVVLSPIPLADEIALMPVFGVMAARIGKGRGLAPRDIPWRPIGATAIAALAARAAVNVTVSYIPGVAAVANCISAVTVTHMLGSYIDDACADPANAHPLTVREVSERLRDAIARRRATPA